ncbi:hypothetical protein CEXT_580931 [Caerostris extrusa]|uniref:Uncharacterized protein n=1 Tax=Caerostris extrusa TaxID=172846 RepID=A0AAV4V1Z3_CAEEX|nr:hypothetical protein CEXT_580931 [Caerostris extrusa]
MGFSQVVVRGHRLESGGRGTLPQLPAHGGHLLHHLHHHHRLLHGQHLRRFCHRHLSERGGAGVQELRAGQESEELHRVRSQSQTGEKVYSQSEDTIQNMVVRDIPVF